MSVFYLHLEAIEFEFSWLPINSELSVDKYSSNNVVEIDLAIKSRHIVVYAVLHTFAMDCGHHLVMF